MAAQRKLLPYGRQCIDDDDVAAVAAVLRGDWLTTGPTVAAFELALAAKVDAVHAVACANGTAALHLAALALGLGPGDVVIVPSMTFLSTANAARYVSAEVVFADVDPETGLMRSEDLERALARPEATNAKAVFPVHYGGQCCDMEAIAKLARARGLAIVEDACHALGTTYRVSDCSVGRIGDNRFSDMATFSFHPVKTIAMGEGGAVTTKDPQFAERLARMRNHGMTRDETKFGNRDLAFAPDGSVNPWYYEMPEPGFNYRASDINCALGLSQLGKFERFAARRRALAKRYDALLAPLSPGVRPTGRVPWCDAVLHLYTVRIDFAALRMDRATLMRRLREAGVGTQVHYIPVHLQPYYRERCGRQHLLGAEAFYASVLSLPLYPAMADADCDAVVNELRRAVER